MRSDSGRTSEPRSRAAVAWRVCAGPVVLLMAALGLAACAGSGAAAPEAGSWAEHGAVFEID